MFTNEAVYRSHRIVDEFKQMAHAELTPPEKYCFNFVPISRRHSILDIGVGTGRTTGPLSDLFEKYVGIDRSQDMIAAAKSLYPSADLRTMDARRLELTDQFDCVMFSFNGIDYVDYPNRQSIFRQIANVMRPEGYFVYSTHNLHNRRVASWLEFLIVKELVRPLRSILRPKKLRAIAYRLINFWRQSGDQSQPFAYVNDEGEGYTLLTTYVDIAEEIKNLERHGFTVVATVGNTKQSAGYDANDSWVYIVAKIVK
jgi:SAM-dependent methyltransferase